jgi:uncharacterized protein YecT (DUF1311 family)
MTRFVASSLRAEPIMPALRRLARFAVAAACLAPVAANAIDANDIPGNAAFSSVPSFVRLCDGDAAILSAKACRDGSYTQQAKALDSALQDALDKAPANIRPLLKRDQYWFGETLRIAANSDNLESKNPANREPFGRMLIQRVATLAQLKNGFGRAGILGKWENAFGSVTVTATGDGGYAIAIATDSGDSRDDEKRWRCQATALVKPSPDGWLTGTFLAGSKPEQVEAAAKAAGYKIAPFKPLAIKMRRQGETLRVVSAEPDGERDNTPDACANTEQVTASFFASGKLDNAAAADKIETTFVAPTFDCARPATASEEEICADPELADNDGRLNRAWKALLPRLDETTRRALIEDQRRWLQEQAGQYPVSLHPAQDKMRSDLHHTRSARGDLGRLLRERIAVLEGFDETRKGLVGLWLGYTAVLKVEPTDDGGVSATGFKWVGDYKGGCEYDMNGKVVNGAFRSGEKRKNPDMLERHHAILIVNRLDDQFASKRFLSDDPDEQKCKRTPGISSTAQLFPVHPSPDIDEMGSWHE